jgi:hypothetical protein
LGAIGAPKKFTIHTKAPGFSKGALSKDSILKGAEVQFKNLGVDSVSPLTRRLYDFFHSFMFTCSLSSLVTLNTFTTLAGIFQKGTIPPMDTGACDSRQVSIACDVAVLLLHENLVSYDILLRAHDRFMLLVHAC